MTAEEGTENMGTKGKGAENTGPEAGAESTAGVESAAEYESFGPEDTFALGKRLGESAKPGSVCCLNGDLGVGKTVFTQGFAAGLGIAEPVDSPTFTIVKQYDSGRLPLYHFDVYRIGDIGEMDEIGYEDCFYGEGVTLIEWAERIAELVPENAVRVTIRKDLSRGFQYRIITVEET